MIEVLEADAGATTAIQVNQIEIVEASSGFEIIEAGKQGPAGPAGGEGISKIAGETLGGHRAVTTGPSSDVIIYADNTNPAHEASVFGITVGAATVGTATLVKTSGEIEEPGWAWTPQGAIYLSTNGILTQTPPTTGFCLALGYAVTSTKMLVNIGQAITLG